MTASAHTLVLNDGIIVPKLAYGTGTKWFKRGDSTDPDAINQELVESILTALRLGFTHIDTAESYGTEPEVGLALGQYLKETGKPRSSIFITTKVSAPPADIKQSLANSLKKLGPSVEGYVDLYLIHSPFWDYDAADSKLPIKQVWSDFESLVDSKQTRSIGVSNWRIQDFKAVLATNPKIKPSVNQIEFHAYSQGLKLRDFVEVEAKIGTVVAAYGPLQPLIKFAENGRVQDVVNKIAATKGAGITGSQVLLAWGWAVGTIQVTTSAKEDRLKEAVAALDVVLTADEVSDISIAGAETSTQRKFWIGKEFDD